MFWLYLIGGLAFAGTALGLAVGYLDAQVLNICKETGQMLFKVCGIFLLIDAIVVIITSRFNRQN